MISQARVRVFVPTLPPGSVWSESIFKVIEDIIQGGFPSLLLSINGVHFQGDPRWRPLRSQFVGTVADQYVNVVIARSGDPFYLTEDVDKRITGSALVHLYTDGVPNVLVTSGELTFTNEEIAGLKKYDRVFSVSHTDIVDLCVGRPTLPPSALVGWLRILLMDDEGVPQPPSKGAA